MQPITESNIHIVRNLLKEKGNIVIVSHHNPDGDAIGSILGLHHALANMGMASKMIIPNDIPDFLAWLPGSESILRFSKQGKEAIEAVRDAGVIFALDFNGFGRLEKLEKHVESSKATKIMIDHHPFPEQVFDYIISETKASSTAELVFEFALLIGREASICTKAASAIFTGIMTDTGSFSYACSNPRTFEIVAKLIALGVSIEEVQSNVYNNYSEGRMRLLGHALSNKMKVFPEHGAAYITLTRDELNSFGYRIGDTEGLVNYPLSIKGIVFSALFVENTNHVKVSLRSRGKFPVNRVSAEHYNGGGHTNAAGGKSFVSMQETELEFIRIIDKFKEELSQ